LGNFGRKSASGSVPGGSVFPCLKALTNLVKARVVRSLSGPHGGCRLARPARQIALLEVMEAVEGPVRGQAASPLRQGDAFEKRLEAAFDRAAGLVRDRFAQVKLSDLAGKRQRG
jgi:DNA-binding IscR family transcriptional regulator